MNQRTLNSKARKLLDAAVAYRKSGVKHFKKDDRHMLDVYESDFKDFLTIVKHIRAGDLHKALLHANQMDTLPREEIPYEVWEWMHDQLERECQ